MKEKSLIVKGSRFEMSTYSVEETREGFIKEASRIWPRRWSREITIYVFDETQSGSIRSREFKHTL